MDKCLGAPRIDHIILLAQIWRRDPKTSLIRHLTTSNSILFVEAALGLTKVSVFGSDAFAFRTSTRRLHKLISSDIRYMARGVRFQSNVDACLVTRSCLECKLAD
jgi:hypothetical protein